MRIHGTVQGNEEPGPELSDSDADYSASIAPACAATPLVLSSCRNTQTFWYGAKIPTEKISVSSTSVVCAAQRCLRPSLTWAWACSGKNKTAHGGAAPVPTPGN
eukprot:CAMPEP_0194275200 /NCGR_PEP_ID=MMETSP0169-20130528/8102_1 /TAXON_ID=218684 /ORGANISM="Corethron pennatum, Strain L29A3" /LENGTH=103 /DNA_ID=CAMNT_0039018609 /DNA_START=64 /DNA_END=376 /DNA_ORIENTATION=-